MADVRIGETVHVYSMAEDGRVVDRLGVVQSKSKLNGTIIIRLYDGQRMSLPFQAGSIAKDAMWSRAAKKNVYIELMLEILADRQEIYRHKLQATTRKIGVMRSCAG